MASRSLFKIGCGISVAALAGVSLLWAGQKLAGPTRPSACWRRRARRRAAATA